MKKLIILLAVLALGLNLSAQKLSLLQPVTVDVLRGEGDKAGTGAWISRINTGVSFIALDPAFNETGELSGFATMPLSKISMGYTRAHYIESDGKAVCNYSASALLLLPTSGDANVAIGVTGSLFNFSIGIGYDLKSGGFKDNVFGIFGVQFLL